ncbi:MAG: hypothetical protein AVDCRST_MAG12-1385, partial [uncultured Rubrobacteraceae bacterium]
RAPVSGRCPPATSVASPTAATASGKGRSRV